MTVGSNWSSGLKESLEFPWMNQGESPTSASVSLLEPVHAASANQLFQLK